VLRKLGLLSQAELAEEAGFCRVPPGQIPIPKWTPRGSLLHFNGVVGDAASKHMVIHHYLQSRLARGRTAG